MTPAEFEWNWEQQIEKRDAEIERLRAALNEIIKEVGTSTLAAKIAREALDHGLPTTEDVRGILNEQLTK